MPADISKRSTPEQNLAQSAISGPLASRALFWRPRFITGDPYAYHLPLSFWLADVVRPTRLMAVGVTDGQSYFGFCQALDKLNVAAMCTGFGTWETIDEDDQIPFTIKRQNSENYSDFSTLRCRTPLAALKPVDAGTLDFLIVNLASDVGDPDLFFDLALRKLSDRGILLIHDLQAAHQDTEKANCLENLRAAHQSIRFGDDDDGLLLILAGNIQDDRLLHFAGLKPGSSEFNTVQAVFHQLGAGHYHAWSSQEEARTAREAQAFAEQSAAERDEISAQYAKLNAAYEERSKKIATEQAQFFDLQQQLSEKSAEIITISDALTAEQQVLEAQVAELTEEKQVLESRTAELTAQLQTRPVIDTDDKKALELQLEMRFKELAILQREILAVEKRAGARVKKIKESTSWRVTAPLRSLSLMFRRKKK